MFWYSLHVPSPLSTKHITTSFTQQKCSLFCLWVQSLLYLNKLTEFIHLKNSSLTIVLHYPPPPAPQHCPYPYVFGSKIFEDFLQEQQNFSFLLRKPLRLALHILIWGMFSISSVIHFCFGVGKNMEIIWFAPRKRALKINFIQYLSRRWLEEDKLLLLGRTSTKWLSSLI